MSGGFAGEVDDSVDLSGGESLEGYFPGDAGFSVASGGFEEYNGGGFEGVFEVDLDGFLARAGRLVGGFKLEFAESGESGAFFVEVVGEAVEVVGDEGVVLVGVETDGLGDA